MKSTDKNRDDGVSKGSQKKRRRRTRQANARVPEATKEETIEMLLRLERLGYGKTHYKPRSRNNRGG